MRHHKYIVRPYKNHFLMRSNIYEYCLAFRKNKNQYENDIQLNISILREFQYSYWAHYAVVCLR